MKNSKPLPRTDDEWKVKLSPEQYRVLRGQGTEVPFTGELLGEHRDGVFMCAGCGATLFSSASKFDDHTGWLAFYEPVDRIVGKSGSVIGEERDETWGMVRVEVHCATCGGHLGHVFDDGPKPTGLRYCINSAALEFEPKPKPRSP